MEPAGVERGAWQRRGGRRATCGDRIKDAWVAGIVAGSRGALLLLPRSARRGERRQLAMRRNAPCEGLHWFEGTGDLLSGQGTRAVPPPLPSAIALPLRTRAPAQVTLERRQQPHMDHCAISAPRPSQSIMTVLHTQELVCLTRNQIQIRLGSSLQTARRSRRAGQRQRQRQHAPQDIPQGATAPASLLQ